MSKKLLFAAVVVTAFVLVSFQLASVKAKPVSSKPAEAVLYWNEIAYEAFGGTKYQHSLMASRINAMVHLAIHDAVNGIEEKYNRYAFTGKDKKADPVAAVASAAYTVLLNEIPAQKTFLDSALNNSLNKVKEGDAKARGLALGEEAARAVVAKRSDDGAAKDPMGKIEPSQKPGVYQAVPPFDIVFAPHWEQVKPFSLQSKSQFRVASHPALNSETYTKAFAEVKEFGKKVSATRSKDQTAFAKFWYEFSEAGWNRVARKAVQLKKLNMLEAARLFALVDMALADAYIAGWDSKFHYNFWRPYTAIQMADKDGNPLTQPEAAWEPCEVTPPVQDYPSTHSALGNAAATVLAKLLGDHTAFTMTSPTAFPEGTTRSFRSFSQAAKENAESRVMAGIHFRFSCDAGLDLGAKVGEWTVENSLKPLK